MVAAQLIAKYPIISDQINKQELLVILTELEQLLARGGSGAVVEFGCYVGTTSLFVTQLLSQFNSSVPYHVFDSFAGLPAKLPQDYSPAGEQFKTGELLATKAQFIAHFKKPACRYRLFIKPGLVTCHPPMCQATYNLRFWMAITTSPSKHRSRL